MPCWLNCTWTEHYTKIIDYSTLDSLHWTLRTRYVIVVGTESIVINEVINTPQPVLLWNPMESSFFKCGEDRSMDTTTAENTFWRISEAIDELGLIWENIRLWQLMTREIWLIIILDQLEEWNGNIQQLMKLHYHINQQSSCKKFTIRKCLVYINSNSKWYKKSWIVLSSL